MSIQVEAPIPTQRHPSSGPEDDGDERLRP